MWLSITFLKFFKKSHIADQAVLQLRLTYSGIYTTTSSKAHSALNQGCPDRTHILSAKLQPVASSGVLHPFQLVAVSAGPVPAVELNLGCSSYWAYSVRMFL